MHTHRTIKSARAGRARARRRRGISLIEVVMASMLLAMIASAVVGGISTVIAGDARNQQRLEALELGNRLLLQYIDDQKAMPPEERHITQGRGTYRWTMRQSPVELAMPEGSVIDKPAEGPGSKTIDKLVLLSVSVYTGIPDGGGGFEYGPRVCTLTRVYHPLSVIYRNPDKMVRMASDPGQMLALMEALIAEGTTSRTDPNAAGGGGGGGRPAAGGSRGSGGPKPAGRSALFNGSRSERGGGNK